ncbi:hypothetical protein [Streptomyces sp. NPDC001665]
MSAFERSSDRSEPSAPGEDLVTDTDGQSRISTEDYAVALIDEIEQSQHPNERFHVAD